jgi:polyadenylation factor subunit 2
MVLPDMVPQVRYWRTNLELVKSSQAHREAVRQLSFAPGDLKYATGSDDSTVRVWDFARVTTEQVGGRPVEGMTSLRS